MALTLRIAHLQGTLLPENEGAGPQPAALPAHCPHKARQGQDIGRGVAQALRHSALKLWRVQRRWKRQVRARLLLDDSQSVPVTTVPSRRTDVRTSKPGVPKKRRRQTANTSLSTWQQFFADYMKKAQSSHPQQARQHMREAAALWSTHKPKLQQQQKGQRRRTRQQRPELTLEEAEERLKRKREQMAKARKARHAQKAPDGCAGLPDAAQGAAGA